MIIGIGLDLTEIPRIVKAYEKQVSFPLKVLTENEQQVFNQLKGKRKMEFLAGRFAAKEAFSKALGTGIGKVGFLDIEVLNDEMGKPRITKSPFNGNVFITITHTDTVAAAQVILENT
ncbi:MULTISPECIES: holo-ACP synthase [Carnobacterium]|uniref:Holo-[acyl-carrier-protein] synthase n=1 Tax=Carnobacterium divergens TaxID=2748 RepID=A0A2R7ZVL4_CARDV|nr:MULTISPECIES: holo-ACP synthase [Carnobacterium]MCO6018622.1 holo-ACP synthase [Carnobacterium divergens]MDT1940790.1 holo-ACP synthase [Carnobacterium divergens]MDT1943229.1 holo-ACP synthase [Carnobacterium divergens]MDT1949035.1 holo-ACP synthase [Carnobacterium divergens]MDT1951519.1 holo-ACP synthase [Carnobacterium divergens]